MTDKSHDKAEQALYDALLTLKTADEMRRFLRDLCTPGEIVDFAERWLIARLLHEGGQSYREISQTTGASTTTVGRVARFLEQEDYGGYRLALERAKS